MKFAIVNGIKVEATKGARGKCPCCKSDVIAKCGDKRVHHWSHLGERNCDDWWEPETLWHRAWKNNFLPEWQETILYDEKTNEKHIADVLTSYGLVIEFQHSAIDKEECISREAFYKNMVWVVDGTRLKGDFKRFQKAKKDFVSTSKPKIYGIEHVDECFPQSWLHNNVPVIFDFLGTGSPDDPNDIKKQLYCLFPWSLKGYRIFAEMSRPAFIHAALNGEWMPKVRGFTDEMGRTNQRFQDELTKKQLTLERMIPKQAAPRPKRNNRRGNWRM